MERQISVRITFKYVLIIEWLDTHDNKTGELLHQYLQKMGLRSVLVRCNSPDDLKVALGMAYIRVPAWGYPVIHIESHGDEPETGTGVDSGFGLSAVNGLSWKDLGRLLAPLNRACSFELLVVGATCYGLGAISAMNIYDHEAPFAATIGFTTAVVPGSLHDSMKELYRSLQANSDPWEAVRNAQRELRSEHEEIKLTTSIHIAFMIIDSAYDLVRSEHAMNETVARIKNRADSLEISFTKAFEESLPELLVQQTQARSREAWNRWFPLDLQMRNEHYRWDDLLADFRAS